MNYRNAKVKNIFTLLLFIGVVVFVYREMITADFLYVHSDGVGYFSTKEFWTEGIKNGEFPLWDPYLSIGAPFMADIQSSVFSPFNILFLLFESPLAFNITYVIFMIMAGYFMYLLMYEYTDTYFISVGVGFIFCFATIMGGVRVEHFTIIASIPFFPAIFYYLEKFKRTRRETWLILCSVTMMVQFLCGFTQIVLYFDIAAFVYLLFILYANKYNIRRSLILVIKWVGSYILLIAIQLIPLLQITLQSARNEITWEFFSVLAYDLRILWMMINPFIYQNRYESFGTYASSGIDIEIYIGVICLIYIVYELVYHWRERNVKIISVILLGSFMWGMVPNIPIIGKIAYNIPLLNSYRVCARSMPIFVFSAIILAGLGMTNLYKSENLHKIVKVSISFIVFIAVLLIFLGSFLSQEIFSGDADGGYYNDAVRGMKIALGLCTINLFVLFVLSKVKKTYAVNFTVILLTIVILADVMRFSNLTNENKGSAETLLDLGLSAQTEVYINEDTEQHYRSFIVMEDMQDMYVDSRLNIAKSCRARISQNKLYNSYLTFLDAKFIYWGIQETVCYPLFINQMKNDNGLLSMLGIHYILDANGHDMEGRKVDESVEAELVLAEDSPSLLDGGDFLRYFIAADWAEANTSYRVTVALDTERPEIFYMALGNAAGVIYPLGNREFQTILTTNENLVDGIFFDLIISPETSVSSLIIEKVQGQNILEKLLTTEDGVDIYVNKEARQIIYIPEYVVAIEQYRDSWEEDVLNNVDTISYVLGIDRDMDFTAVHSEVKDICERRNAVSATISSDTEVFVNHSQLAYPGWKAYVDGVEVKLYTVNNLIQGAVVPSGEHVIEFRFEPNDFKLGGIITLLGGLGCCVWFAGELVKRYRETNERRKQHENNA